MVVQEALNWQPLGSHDIFFSRRDLYDLPWRSMDLGAFHIAAAAHGGPVAVLRDPRVMTEVTDAPLQINLQIFTAGGALLGSQPWHQQSSPVALFWTPCDALGMVDAGGHVSFRGWDARPLAAGLAGGEGGPPVNFSLPLPEGSSVTHVAAGDHALACVTSDGTLFMVSDVREPTPEEWHLPGKDQRIVGLAVAPARLSPAGTLEVVVLTPTSVIRADQSGASITQLNVGPGPKTYARRLALAPGGQLFGVLSDTADLYGKGGAAENGGSSSAAAAGGTEHDATHPGLPFFAPRVSPWAEGSLVGAGEEEGSVSVLRAFSLGERSVEQLSEHVFAKGSPHVIDVAWCGGDCLAVLTRDRTLTLVGPFGDELSYALDDPAVLCPEVDGLRVLTCRRHVWVARVPQCHVDTFQVGSVEPPARLLEARSRIDEQDPDADHLISALSAAGGLKPAAEAVLEAALYVWDPPTQRVLMGAASLAGVAGAGGLAGRVPETAITVRALNAARRAPLSCPLTARQLGELTPRGLVRRLCLRGEHPAAYEVAKALGVDASEVLEHWAAWRVATAAPSESDSSLFALLQDRLAMEGQGSGAVSYSRVALKAAEQGRRTLAARLLDLEPSPARAVPLLLDLGGGAAMGRALDKATESGDPDLLYLCLFRVLGTASAPGILSDKSDKTVIESLRAICARPQARATFLAYCNKAGHRELALELAAPGERAAADVEDAVAAALARPREKEGPLALEKATRALKSAGQGADRSGLGPDTGPYEKPLHDASRLLLRQSLLEKDTGIRGLAGMPLAATVKQLILTGHAKQASDLAKEFGLSDRAYIQAQVDALIALKAWEKLLNLLAKGEATGGAAQAAALPAPTAAEGLIRPLKEADAPAHVLRHVVRRLPDIQRRIEAFRDLGMEAEAQIEEQGKGVAPRAGLPEAQAPGSTWFSLGGWGGRK